MYSSQIIQDLFIDFFKNKNHSFVPSSPIIPRDDNTLLFTNAGMNQFKDFFTGNQKSPYPAAVSAQNCIRAGGKHNDLSEVGYTERHLTHFVMLGNFAFENTYFKKEAITYAWEFLTEILKIKKDLLVVTVYEEDEEAYEIWEKTIKIPKEKIYRLGKKDNFWFMGDAGPCGPCSEIYFDRGIFSEADKNSFPSDDKSSRFIEIWNLVFMEYEKKNNELIPLVNKGIDTGMGLERIASVLQEKKTVFEIDSFQKLIHFLEKITEKKYLPENAVSFHVLSDHARTTGLLLQEKLLPSNEGRGYVLRKIIRRALLFSRNLSSEKNIFKNLVLFYLSSTPNTQIQTAVADILEDETNKFFDNLEKGISLFNTFLKQQKNSEIFNGKDAFTLYDTYGFPLEITEILAKQAKLTIDIKKYEEAMKEQKERSKIQNQELFQTMQTLETKEISSFDYHTTEIEARILELFIDQKTARQAIPNQLVTIIVDKSTFYPTGGGQVHDDGIIVFSDKNQAKILNVKKYGRAIGITCLAPTHITVGDTCTQVIDVAKRRESEKHHSATHILFAAIKNYFNDNTIEQAGSFVCNTYLTLDLKINHSVSADDRYEIQRKVNQSIGLGRTIREEFKTLAEAQKENATATFTEKYNPQNVRVIVIDTVTKDLCGGCHAKNTAELGLFILKEVTSAGNGIKRFIGLTGNAAYQYLEEIDLLSNELKKKYSCPIEKILNECEKREELYKEQAKKILQYQKELVHYFAFSLQKELTGESIQKELPASIATLGREVLSQITPQNKLIILYFKKDKEYQIFGCTPPWTPEEKNNFIENIRKNYNFKGFLKGNIFQGMVTNLPK
jgi:alanyl-tRNA synthetase